MQDDQWFVIEDGRRWTFEALVSKYNERVFQLAHRWVDSPEDAEDVAMKAWEIAWRKRATFKGVRGACFYTWLCGILKNLVRVCNRTRQPPMMRIDWFTHLETSAWDGPWNSLLASEFLDRVKSHGSEDQYNSLIALLEGWTSKEAAARLGINDVAYKSRLARARKTAASMIT